MSVLCRLQHFFTEIWGVKDQGQIYVVLTKPRTSSEYSVVLDWWKYDSANANTALSSSRRNGDCRLPSLNSEDFGKLTAGSVAGKI